MSDYFMMIPFYLCHLKKPTEYNVNAEIGKMQVWLEANKLSINISKTKDMILSPKFKSGYKFKIELLGDLLEQVDSLNIWE